MTQRPKLRTKKEHLLYLYKGQRENFLLKLRYDFLDFLKSIISSKSIQDLRFHMRSFSGEDKHPGNYTSHLKIEQEQQQEEEKLFPFTKRILIVDDDPDITLTFKKGLEAENENSKGKIFFQVFTYNDPLLALAEFKINFYDLLLLDVNMPKLNGFELSEKTLELDLNARVCYISAGEINIEALREQYKSLSMGCFIKKPVEIEKFVRRVKTELE
jgi:CheY-like chemotaxis protein